MFWGIVLFVTSFILYYNSQTPFKSYSTPQLKKYEMTLDKEEKILRKKLRKKEDAFSEKIKKMAESRKGDLLEEPQDIQKAKKELFRISFEKERIADEIKMRENNSRRLFILGMIVGILVIVGGIILIIIK